MAQHPTALVTGGSRGLGLALARALADAGWSLVVDARHDEALADAMAPLTAVTRIEAVSGDIADPAHRNALADAVTALGGLDVLVLNAGTLGPTPLPPVAAVDLDELRGALEVNVVAQLAVVQALLPQLRPGSSIVAITSDAAVQPYAGWGAYGASKAALEQLMAVLTVERPDLRVLWVDPGDLRTQMHQDAFPGEDISDRPLPEEVAPQLCALLGGRWASGRYRLADVPTPLEVGT
jgi:NAD(P)-dependent dehydrogenase (short-subunit alcohol dehydrogenase family)